MGSLMNMRLTATFVFVVTSLGWSTVLRTNEQGVSSTHSYTRLGSNEVVSNLNGNLVLSIPVADVTGASPLGIHLERTYNSHWRDPLVAFQFDVVNKGGYGYRNSPNWDWRDVRWSQDQFGLGAGDVLGFVNYDNPGKSATNLNAAASAALGFAVVTAPWTVTQVGEGVVDLFTASSGRPRPTPNTSVAWGGVAFAAASLALDIWSIAEHEEDLTTEEKIDYSLSMSRSVANLAVSLARINKVAIGSNVVPGLASISAAIHLYQYIRNQDEHPPQPWDPGYETNQYLFKFSLGFDLMGAVLVWTPFAPVGYGLMTISAVLELGAYFVATADLASMRWDMGEVWTKPWSLSVNGYIAMAGTKNPQDWGTAAYPFSQVVGQVDNIENRGHLIDDRNSVHPMPDMFLLRSGGGADRFLLQPWDGVARFEDGDSVRWYAYVAAGDGRTKVYYRDAKPYQSNSGIVDDPGDFYVVKEPNGTWARFGARPGTKGVDLRKSGYNGKFETYWALPNSIHHFGGDSVDIIRAPGSQTITDVRHSRDSRQVHIQTTGSTEETKVIGPQGETLSSVSINWQAQAPHLRRHEPESGAQVYMPIKMPMSVTVPVANGKTLTTNFAWDDGDLSAVSYPDGSIVSYTWYRDKRAGPLDGFLHKRVHYSREDGTGSFVEHECFFDGWLPGRTSGAATQTEVIRRVGSELPDGGVSIASTSNRYEFAYSQSGTLVRNRPCGPLPETADTNIACYNSVGSIRLQLSTAWEGTEGNGTRTDYIWEGDRLRMKMVRPGMDTAFVPLVTTFHYDNQGNLIASQTNPADFMGKLEWSTLLILSGAASESMSEDSVPSREALRAAISAKIGKNWEGRFDTLDRTELFGWHNERASELVQDTSYLDYNPYRKRDSAAWVYNDTARINALNRSLASYAMDSVCWVLHHQAPSSGDEGGQPSPNCVVNISGSTLDSVALWMANNRVQTAVAIDSARALNRRDDSAWRKLSDTVVVHWKQKSHSFDPYGRYVSIPTGQWVTRKHPDAAQDTLALGNALIGSVNVYDSLLRLVRVDMYRHDTLPGVRYEYGDSHFPYAPTGVRTYVGNVSGNLQYRYARVTLDSLGMVIKTHSWKRLFTEAADAEGLPGKVATEVTSAGTADFTTTLTRDGRGRVTKVVDARGGVSEAEYDLLDRVTRSKSPGGSWSSATYQNKQDANGIIWTESLRESGVKDITGVNGLGWPVVSGSVSADGKDSVLSRRGYGLHGVQWMQDGEGRLVTFNYDSRGRRVWTTIPKADGSQLTWRTSFNDLERSALEIDPQGKHTKTFFDIEGAPIRVERQVGGMTWSTEARYDNLGNVVWTRSPSGDTTLYAYTLQNLLDSTRTPQGLTVKSHYNWLGDPTQTSRRGTGSGLLQGTVGGDSSSLAYDGLGRLTAVSMAGQARMSQSLIYDTTAASGVNVVDPGMLLSVSRGTGAASVMGYDARGALLSRRQVSGISQELSDTLMWAYQTDGKPSAQVLPRGARIQYGWDKLDRVGKVTFVDPKGISHVVVDTLVYRKGGALDSLQLGNGVGQKFGYDTTTGALTRHRVTAKGRVLGERSDRYDDAGRLVERTRLDGQAVYYEYDDLDRLKSVRYGLGNGSGQANFQYVWNAEGARTEFVHDFGKSEWAVGVANSGSTNQSLTSQGSHDGHSRYGWDWNDALGSRRWQSSATDTTLHDSVGYGWNPASELERFTRVSVSADRKDTTLLAQSFGDHGLRSGKYRGKVTGTDTLWSLDRRSVWEGPDVVADSTVGDSAWRYRIVLGLNAVAEAERDSSGAWHLTYVVSDPVGSPEILLNDTGAVVGRAVFGPFGELEEWKGSKMPDFLFGGREWDGDIQAQVFGYRLYDPVQGQFLSQDPMDQFWNPYSYVGGEPLSGVDPWGLTENGASCGSNCIIITGSAEGNAPSDNTAVTATYQGPRLPDPGTISTPPPISMPSVDLVESPFNTLLFGFPADFKTAFSYASQGRTKDWMKVWAKGTVKGLALAVAGPVLEKAGAVRGAVGGGAGPRIASGSQVTDAIIRESMKDAPLKTQQARGISLPMVQEYVDKLLAGEVAPPIQVDGGIIVNGNHRYVAGRILGIEPQMVEWVGGRPGSVVPWRNIPINPESWR